MTIDRTHHECIDPTLGDQLWRLDDPSTDPALHERLLVHCEHCPSCRLERELEAALTASGQQRTRRRVATAPRRLATWMSGAGAAALAASVTVLLLVAPPAPERLERSTDSPPAIERPLAGEVVLGGQPEIVWTPLADARAYDVKVTAVDGTAHWAERTEQSRIRVPADHALPAGDRYRVVVTTVPRFAGPREGLTETFHVGGPLGFVRYRATAGWPPARWGALAGLVAMVAGLAAHLAMRRSV